MVVTAPTTGGAGFFGTFSSGDFSFGAFTEGAFSLGAFTDGAFSSGAAAGCAAGSAAGALVGAAVRAGCAGSCPHPAAAVTAAPASSNAWIVLVLVLIAVPPDHGGHRPRPRHTRKDAGLARRLLPLQAVRSGGAPAASRARYSCTRRTATEPSPTAEATRLTEPCRTSPDREHAGQAGLERQRRASSGQRRPPAGRGR